MNLSSEPSIETLPEFYTNGVIDDTNVINDQTIANFCSDTVRELNNLTEELHHTNLDEIRNRNNFENNLNCFDGIQRENSAFDLNKSVHNNISDGVQMDSQSNGHCVNVDHNYAISYQNGSIMNNGFGDIGNGNCDVVDSSPFYTQFNQHIENNSNSNYDSMARLTENNLLHENFKYESANENDQNVSDEDNANREDCMLQSVDLRGVYYCSIE